MQTGRHIAALLLLAFSGVPVEASGPADFMVELSLKGRRIEGLPLRWDATAVHLLGRDGRLWQFSPDEAAQFRRTADHFRPCSPAELRADLLRESGTGFEVSGTGHYLVAHPSGQRDLWAGRFEELYRSFVRYFAVRGLKVEEPRLPLVGVVYGNRAEFARAMAEQGTPVAPGVLGWYSLVTNRIVLYDVGGKEAAKRWQENGALVIHEATHQTAFNTGVHSRYTRPPLWAIEGLATMFEAPGVYDSRNYTRLSDRINRDRLAAFRKFVRPWHRPELIAGLVASDAQFQKNPGAAYAEAWSLTLYLVETQPRQYAKYLERTAQRPAFVEYSPSERTADFTGVFGSDWRMLEARFLRFIDGL